MLHWLIKHKIKLAIAMALLGAGVLFALVNWTDLELEDIRAWVNYWTEQIRALPAVLFFFMMALLPLVGVPVSPLFIISGIRFGVGWAIPFSLCALAVNLMVSHWVCTKLMHRFIQRIADNWDYTIPKVSRENAVKWVFVVRMSGAPLAVQNYILGLAYVPFWPYLLVSLATQAPVVIGMIVFGESFISGNAGKALMGLAVLVLAFVAVAYFRKRYAHSKPGSIDTAS